MAEGQIRSTSSGGAWNDPATWEGSVVPDSTDDVLIVSGAEVLFDKPPIACTNLEVEEGATLRSEVKLQLAVLGDVVNRGDIVGENGAMLTHGSILNAGVWTMRLAVDDGGPRTLVAYDAARDVDVLITGNVFLTGGNVVSRIDAIADNGGQLTIEDGGSLQLTVAPEPGYVPADLGLPDESQFASFGTVIVPNVPSQVGNVVIGSNLLAGFQTETQDSLWVETHSDQTHPAFANAVRNWYRFRWHGNKDPFRPEFFTLSLYFRERHLGIADPESLFVFHSPDRGETWIQITQSPLEVVYDEEKGEGFVHLTGVPSEGDYVFASSSTPLSSRPVANIVVEGRSQIRVGGPPQLHRVRYANPGSLPVGRTVVGIKTGGGAYIDRIVPSSGSSGDSGWSPEVFAPDGDSTEALIMTSPLGPGEARTFSVYLRAIPESGSEKLAVESLNPAIAGAIILGIATGYLTDFAFHAAEEVLSDPCNQRGGIKDKLRTAFDRTDDNWNPFGNSESPWMAAAENGANELAQSGLVKSGFSALNVLNLLSSASSTVANGTERYEQNTGRSIWEPVDCDPPPRPDVPRDNDPLEPVSSWDPNEKLGPGGFGVRNFVSSFGRMEYVINFENKAEATAPAHRIVIVDTLSSLLAPSSVRFGPTSHEGWTTTHNANVLRWEIEGIELPPNVNPPEGEGFVSFTAKTIHNLPSGSEIGNRATITFDLNEPITTNTHANVLDLVPPNTVMDGLPPEVEGSVDLTWTANDPDNGSGVASAAVFASRDGGAFELIGYSDHSGFTADVEPNSSYAFFALSSDRVGNSEIARPVPVETFVVATDVKETRPFRFELEANYPNPFRKQTTIEFEIPAKDKVELVVFDLLGRQVLTLVDRKLPAGRHVVVWKPTSMASGLYFCRLETGELSKSIPMVVVR